MKPVGGLAVPAIACEVPTNDAGTYYRVVESRSRANAQELIGSDYGGVLVSDCLNIYDDLTLSQHKCYAHHLKAIKQALTTPTAQGSAYLSELRALLKAAIALKSEKANLPDAAVAKMRAALEENATRLLSLPRDGPKMAADAHQQANARQEDKVRQRLALKPTKVCGAHASDFWR